MAERIDSSLERGSAVLGFEAAPALRPTGSVAVVRSAFVRVAAVVGAVVAALVLVAPGSAASGAVGPSVSLSVGPASSGVAPLPVIAFGSVSTGSVGSWIVSYSFDFGDGSPPQGRDAGAELRAGHTYTDAGTYTV